ncbi:hypothetical protein CYMTET_22457, partial [Cymbomonas tetramitiformis]
MENGNRILNLSYPIGLFSFSFFIAYFYGAYTEDEVVPNLPHAISKIIYHPYMLGDTPSHAGQKSSVATSDGAAGQALAPAADASAWQSVAVPANNLQGTERNETAGQLDAAPSASSDAVLLPSDKVAATGRGFSIRQADSESQTGNSTQPNARISEIVSTNNETEGAPSTTQNRNVGDILARQATAVEMDTVQASLQKSPAAQPADSDMNTSATPPLVEGPPQKFSNISKEARNIKTNSSHHTRHRIAGTNPMQSPSAAAPSDEKLETPLPTAAAPSDEKL